MKLINQALEGNPHHDPRTLLAHLKLGGFRLETDGKTLTVYEARWVDDELAGLLKRHKQELIRLLQGSAHHG